MLLLYLSTPFYQILTENVAQGIYNLTYVAHGLKMS